MKLKNESHYYISIVPELCHFCNARLRTSGDALGILHCRKLEDY